MSSLGSDWHVRSKGGFAGTIIGIFLLAIAIEAVRRAHREYDKRLIAQRRPLLTAIATPTHALTKDDSSDASPSTPLRSSVRQAGPTMGQQAIRAGFFGLQSVSLFSCSFSPLTPRTGSLVRLRRLQVAKSCSDLAQVLSRSC